MFRYKNYIFNILPDEIYAVFPTTDHDSVEVSKGTMFTKSEVSDFEVHGVDISTSIGDLYGEFESEEERDDFIDKIAKYISSPSEMSTSVVATTAPTTTKPTATKASGSKKPSK